MATKNLTIQKKDEKRIAPRFDMFNPFAAFRQEMDRIFDDFFSGLAVGPATRGSAVFSPKVDVIDSEKEIKVTVELPGMDEKDIDLSLSPDSLTIKGEKKEEKEEKGKNYFFTERVYGSFSRTVAIPVEIETDKVEASFKKGVLTVTMPKTQKALKETKKIPIKVQ